MATTAARRLPEVDGLRALAVLAVFACHAMSFGPVALNHAFFVSGAHGVDLFFVVSGFCLAYPMLRQRRENERLVPRILPFLRLRFARVAPPYYVAVLVFGLLSFTHFGLPTWPGVVPTAHAQLVAMGQDLLFLTNQKPIHNCDFWTLGVEMRWYVLFPLLLALYVRTRLGFAATMLAMYAIYASPYGIPDLGMFPCFMFGIVAADLAVREAAWRKYAAPFAVLAIAFACWMQSHTTFIDHGDVVWQVAAFLTVVSVTGNTRIARAFSQPALVLVGVASYSIYLVHHPVLAELAIRGVPLWMAASASLATGLCFWYVVERPLARDAVRRAIVSALRFDRVAKPLAQRASN